ncbi:collagen alpha-1(II) chain-like [Columba livia]|uniref:collagen alpha-1(II) chain-like n=1 Tax=Columba livia TaxID=8932 RepID=UPI0031BB5681
MEAANQRWRREAEAVLSRYPPPALVLWALQRLAEESSRLWEAEPEPDLELDPELDPRGSTHCQEPHPGSLGRRGVSVGPAAPPGRSAAPPGATAEPPDTETGGGPQNPAGCQAGRGGGGAVRDPPGVLGDIGVSWGVIGVFWGVIGVQGGSWGILGCPGDIGGHCAPFWGVIGVQGGPGGSWWVYGVSWGCWGAVAPFWGPRPGAAGPAAAVAGWRHQGAPDAAAPPAGAGEGGGAAGDPPPLWWGRGSGCSGYWENWEHWESPPRAPPRTLCCPFSALWSSRHIRPHRRRCAGRPGSNRKRGHRGAGPEEGAWPALPRPVGQIVGGADPELLSRLRLVATQTQRRMENWPRLLELVSQWWAQPAQWTLATPPGSLPFSHWLQRWTRAAQALPWPRPLPLAPPTEGQDEEQPQL